MRVMIATSSLPPGAGIGTYVHNLASWMSSAGHEVIVCRSAPLTDVLPEQTGYRVIDIPVPDRVEEEAKAIAEMYELILNLSPHVIINNDNIFLSNLLPYLPEEIVRISVVHGYRRRIASWDAHRVIFRAAMLNHAYLDYVVAISTPMQKAISEMYRCPKEKVRLIYNGVPSDRDAITEQRERKNSLVQIVFAGGSNKTKGADVMLSAAKKLSDEKKYTYQIQWLGYLPGEGKYCKTRLEAIPQVRAIGRLPHEELQKVLDAADVLVMPSRAEGCPMLLLEGMNKGLAAVVSDCPSAMAETVKNSGCGYVVPVGSSNELKKALDRLIVSDAERRAMSQNAVTFFNRYLTMDCCGRKMEELFRRPEFSGGGNRELFPPQYFVPFHRRPYPTGSKMKPSAFAQRIRFIFGWLPGKRVFKL